MGFARRDFATSRPNPAVLRATIAAMRDRRREIDRRVAASRRRWRYIRRRTTVAAGVVIVVVVGLRQACAPDGGQGARWVATARAPEVAAYAQPGDAKPTHVLPNPDQNGTALVFLVDDDDADGQWMPVYLPVRPNGTTGWIRARDVTLTQTRYRITVDLSSRTLQVTHDGSVTLQTRVAVGTKDTPTPGGTYYITEVIAPPDPDTIYGPYVLGLSGYSTTLDSFEGRGQGVIGIHGTNDESALGTRVSAGCIRVHNDIITNMAKTIPLGTPVDLVP